MSRLQHKITVTDHTVIIESATGAPVSIPKQELRRALDNHVQDKHSDACAARRFANSEGWVDGALGSAA